MMRVEKVGGDFKARSFQDYLALKYQVFVQERGWALPSDKDGKRVLEDKYDKVSDQYVAYDAMGHAAGTVRVTHLDTEFPYKGATRRPRP